MKRRKKASKRPEMSGYACAANEQLTGPLFKEVCEEIDRTFILRMDELRLYFFIFIFMKCFSKGIPPHYELEDDGDPYDHSGVLVEKGVIAPAETTVAEFLDEYTGEKEATYMPGHGWRYLRYSDEMSFSFGEVAAGIVKGVIRRHIDTSRFAEYDEWFFWDKVLDVFIKETLADRFFTAESLYTENDYPLFDGSRMLADCFFEIRPYLFHLSNRLIRLVEKRGTDLVKDSEIFDTFVHLPKLVKCRRNVG